MGYHEIAGPGEVELLLPVRDLGHLLALRRRLDGRQPRNRALAEVLIRQTCAKQGSSAQLTIHADRGSSMTSKPVAFLLADLGVTQSHSRPHVSNDNPFSEAQFKTLKYRPDFPGRFGSIEDARQHCQAFFPWYNEEHRHTGWDCTPADVHYGLARGNPDKACRCTQRRLHRTPRTVRPQTAQTPADPRNSWINRPDQPEENTRKYRATVPHSG